MGFDFWHRFVFGSIFEAMVWFLGFPRMLVHDGVLREAPFGVFDCLV